MQAQEFYQTTTEQAIALVLISKANCSSFLEGSSSEVRQAFLLQQFKGKLGDVVVLGDEQRCVSAYIGQGDGTDALAVAHAMPHLPAGVYAPDVPLSMRAMVVWSLAQYRFNRYKFREIQRHALVVSKEELPDVLAEAASIFLVRDLINTPGNDMGPDALAGALKSLAEEHGATYEQWVGPALLQHNYPAIHAVGRAAAIAPRLAQLTWGEETHPRVTLVGKGVCFDSGGLDIKPSSGMRLMKKDMGGAAQVMGLAKWLMMLKLPIRLQVLIPAVENAIGSRAYRPGDVLTMRNGKTVEIDNTDAEGRLVLADALVKACEEKPAVLIDFATLTGAARVAVGTEISALFSNDDALAEGILAAAQDVGDAVWRMPLFPGYASMLDSTIADCVNSSPSSYAGAIVAGLFLESFIDKGTAWAHFDLMSWNLSSKPGKPEGGEAMGIQAVAAYLIERFGG
jgi:leucyl aminopeptidase